MFIVYQMFTVSCYYGPFSQEYSYSSTICFRLWCFYGSYLLKFLCFRSLCLQLPKFLASGVPAFKSTLYSQCSHVSGTKHSWHLITTRTHVTIAPHFQCPLYAKVLMLPQSLFPGLFLGFCAKGPTSKGLMFLWILFSWVSVSRVFVHRVLCSLDQVSLCSMFQLLYVFPLSYVPRVPVCRTQCSWHLITTRTQVTIALHFQSPMSSVYQMLTVSWYHSPFFQEYFCASVPRVLHNFLFYRSLLAGFYVSRAGYTGVLNIPNVLIVLRF